MKQIENYNVTIFEGIKHIDEFGKAVRETIKN